MLDPKELQHIHNCIDETRKMPVNDKRWEHKLSWLYDRAKNSWYIGSISVDDYFKLVEKIDKLANARKAKLEKLKTAVTGKTS